jgi:hypothetical protein
MRALRPLGCLAAALLASAPGLGNAAAGSSFAAAVRGATAISAIDALGDAGDSSCATVEVLTVQQTWDDLDDAARARATSLLPQAFHPEGTGGSVPRGGVECDLTLANVIESEHFSIEWGPAVDLAGSTAEHLLAAMEDARRFLLDEGYPEPAGNPSVRVPFYFGNSGGRSPSIPFSGGFTTMCSGGEHAFIVMSDMRADEGSVELATHELFHAVQLGGVEPYQVDGFYWEASATWAEDFVQPDWNTYAWVLYAYTEDPSRPLADGSVFLHRYGLFILVAYLAEHSPGGFEAVRRVWTAPGAALGPRLEAYWESIDDRTDFPEQFGHFTARTAVMDYADHDTYLAAAITPKAVLTPPESLAGVGSPGLYGSHFYRIDSSGSNGRTKLRVHFEGAQDRQWIVATSRSPDGRESISTQMYLDRQGAQTLDLLDVGTLYEETWVIVTRIGVQSSSYDLSLEFLEQTEEPGSDLLPPEDEDRDPWGSGCTASETHPFAWPISSVGSGAAGSGILSALLGLLLVRRRP